MAGISDTIAPTLGSRIRDLRQRRRMELRRLAYLCHIDRANLSRIETGKRLPSIRTLRVIAAALGVTCGELLD